MYCENQKKITQKNQENGTLPKDENPYETFCNMLQDAIYLRGLTLDPFTPLCDLPIDVHTEEKIRGEQSLLKHVLAIFVDLYGGTDV